MSLLPQTFHVDIPAELTTEIVKCHSNQAVRELGVEWAIQQSIELLKSGVPVIHFFTMGRSDNIYEIVKAVY